MKQEEARNMSEKIKVEEIKDYRTEEAIRRLSVNISNSYPEVKTILVSSVAGKEGKTFISLHMARILAARGVKTLYINGDLRTGCGEREGLAEVMAGTVESTKVTYESNCKNLSIIPAGKSSVMIDEVVLKKLLKEVKGAYEYIIIDSPSLGEVVDGMIIGKFCDGVLLVLEPEIVEEKRIRAVKEELVHSGCNILGVAINKKEK